MGKAAKKQQADSVTSLLFDLGLYVGVMRATSENEIGEGFEAEFNTKTTRAVDIFTTQLKELDADPEAVKKCRKRLDKFKDKLDGYYDIYHDSSGNECRSIESIEPAREALNQLDSALENLLLAHYIDAGRNVFEFGKDIGCAKGLFIVFACGGYDNPITPSIKLAKDVLVNMDLSTNTHKRLKGDLDRLKEFHAYETAPTFGVGIPSKKQKQRWARLFKGVDSEDRFITDIRSVIVQAVSVPAPVMGDKSASSDEARNDRPGQPPKKPEEKIRLWGYDYCPNCGLEVIEWVQRKKFAERAGIGPDAVTRRVRKGKYWTRVDKQIPWCEECKERTPGGAGEYARQQVADYIPPREHQEELIRWCNELLVDKGIEERVGDSAGYDEDEEIRQHCLEAVLEACKERERELSRNEVWDIAEGALKKYRSQKKGESRRRINTDPDEFPHTHQSI